MVTLLVAPAYIPAAVCCTICAMNEVKFPISFSTLVFPLLIFCPAGPTLAL